MNKRQTVNMCDGPIFKNIVRYAVPLILTGLLQLLYNAADIIVVAKWAGGTALAAVGSNGALINLIVNVFVGLSVGASVIVSRFYGAEDKKNLHESVHCAMSLSIICGVITLVIGLMVSRPALVLMSTPDDVIGQATTYLRIYFLGMPAFMIYNFGAAILRAVGDTKRPLYILMASGLVNVILNLILVIGFHMDVEGVAIATLTSQVISAVAVVVCLMRTNDVYKFEFRKLRLYPQKLVAMLRNGIPAGIQGSIFSISNILIQSSVNSFGSAVVSGNAAAANVEGFVYVAMNSLHHTCLAFMSQNIGAGKFERLSKIFKTCIIIVIVVGLVVGGTVFIFGEQLMSLYTAASGADQSILPEDIVKYGMNRLEIICTMYFLCGIMDVLVGALRGMGSPWMPMIVSIVGVCGIRITWIYTVFRFYTTPESLYVSYIVSWLVTASVHFICYIVVSKKFRTITKNTDLGIIN
ncbi:MAG: MATE family efflux transporter [Clostridia bacterium]|nr:MATE family efflux transporter [Clostridia bacterium]